MQMKLISSWIFAKKLCEKKKICKFRTVHFQHCCSVEFEKKNTFTQQIFRQFYSINLRLLGEILSFTEFSQKLCKIP